MTKTHRTKGKTLPAVSTPSGKCDMCNERKAEFWFGSTSVALCGHIECDEKNMRKWNSLLEDLDNDYRN